MFEITLPETALWKQQAYHKQTQTHYWSHCELISKICLQHILIWQWENYLSSDMLFNISSCERNRKREGEILGYHISLLLYYDLTLYFTTYTSKSGNKECVSRTWTTSVYVCVCVCMYHGGHVMKFHHTIFNTLIDQISLSMKMDAVLFNN